MDLKVASDLPRPRVPLGVPQVRAPIPESLLYLLCSLWHGLSWVVELLWRMVGADFILTCCAGLHLVVSEIVISHRGGRIAVRLQWIVYRDIFRQLEAFTHCTMWLSLFPWHLRVVSRLFRLRCILDLRLPAVDVPSG